MYLFLLEVHAMIFLSNAVIMKKEKRDLYNEKLEKTEFTYFKGESIPDGLYPMVVMILIQNSKNEFLMQKRVPNKGGDCGVTGGHPKSGETCLEGIITETKEELGIDISNQRIIEFASGCDGKDCYRMYYTKMDLDIYKLDIQKEELTEVQWFSIDTLTKMVDNKELNENQIATFLKCMKFLKDNNID